MLKTFVTFAIIYKKMHGMESFKILFFKVANFYKKRSFCPIWWLRCWQCVGKQLGVYFEDLRNSQMHSAEESQVLNVTAVAKYSYTPGLNS